MCTINSEIEKNVLFNDRRERARVGTPQPPLFNDRHVNFNQFKTFRDDQTFDRIKNAFICPISEKKCVVW